VAPQVASISEVVAGYEARSKKLPKKLRGETTILLYYYTTILLYY
jgi:hypothetical protein